MEQKPYDKNKVDEDEYYDYNFRLHGRVVEVSVRLKDGLLIINTDEETGGVENTEFSGHQVMNEDGNPAGDSDGTDLCIFGEEKDAKEYIKVLKEDCGKECEEFTIRDVEVKICSD